MAKLHLRLSREWNGRRILAAGIFAFGALPLFASEPQEFQPRKGKIEFADATHDFGTVSRGDRLSYKFTFKNTGEGPLAIQGVHAACGCTVATFDSNKVYNVGEGGEIEVVLDSTSFRGPLSKQITVMTNSSLMPATSLTLSAKVKDDISANPPIIDFSEVTAKDEVEKTVRVTADPASNINVSGVEFNKNRFEVTHQQVDKNNWDVKVKLKPQQNAGFLKDTVYVLNDSASLKKMPVLVRANITGSIRPSLSYLEFGSVPLKSQSEREFQLNRLAEFNITGSEMELNINGQKIATGDVPNYLKIENKTTSPEATAQKMKVTLLNGTDKPGSVHGRLTFLTNDPSQNKVSVDFYAFFSDKE